MGIDEPDSPIGKKSHFVSNTHLSAFRVAFAVWCIYFLVWQLSISNPVLKFWFFAANWDWTFLTFFSWSCCYLSLGCPPKFYNVIHKILFSISLSIAWPITLGFWIFHPKTALASGRSPESYFTIINLNSANLIFGILALILSKTKVSIKYLVFPLFVASFYIIAVSISFAKFETGWPYESLSFLGNSSANLNAGYAVATIIVVLAVVTLFFFLNILLIKIRDNGRIVEEMDDITPEPYETDQLDFMALTRIRVRRQSNIDEETANEQAKDLIPEQDRQDSGQGSKISHALLEDGHDDIQVSDSASQRGAS